MSDLRVLSLDPGGTTGYCYAQMQEGRLLLTPGEDRFTHLDMAAVLESFIQKVQGKHVVYEGFDFRNAVRKGTDLTPVELIGIIKLYQGQYEPMVSFYEQRPSAQGAKAFFNNDRLKELGVYWAHGKGHARSATAHLLYWLNFGAGSQYLDIYQTPMELGE